jgi:hypothetical protein
MIKKNTMKLTKNGTFNLVYAVEYQDSEDRYDQFFYIYNTIFRNVPLRFLNKLNNTEFKAKVKAFCDKNYKELASNATGNSKVEIIVGDEYYRTYEDEFGTDQVGIDNSLFNDYGQLVNGRQFFKNDFEPELTNQYTYKNLNKRNTYMKGLQ